MLPERLLFAHDLNYDRPLAWINIRLHEKQRLPSSELHFSVDYRQRLVRRKHHRAEMGMSVRGMIVIFVSGHQLFKECLDIFQERIIILSQDQDASCVGRENVDYPTLYA